MEERKRENFYCVRCGRRTTRRIDSGDEICCGCVRKEEEKNVRK